METRCDAENKPKRSVSSGANLVMTEVKLMRTATIYQKDSNIVARKVGEEFILVPIRQDAGDLAGFYSLNYVGGRIWELLDGKRSVSDIARVIFDEFEVDAEKAEKEALHFIERLVELGMVTVCKPEV